MPHIIGTVTDSSDKLAHQNLLEVIKDFAEDNGWVTERFDDTVTDHELILKGPGLSNTEEIFIGFQTYQNVAADYYNIRVGGFTGYLSSSTWLNQPGIISASICAHNTNIDYWITLNGQRITGALRVGTPVYEPFYLGKMLPYGRPSQYPYPMLISGTLVSGSTLRFSDTSTSHSMGFKGNSNRMRLRTPADAQNPYGYPWGNSQLAGETTALRDTATIYPMLPVQLHNNNTTYPNGQIWGYLDGVYYISGFNNAVENTLEIDGVEYVVIQDVFRTGFPDYCAIRLDENVS